ncbi:MAG: PaaI family thioesterase [candidate division WOR-3 bacterium]|nr:PaaI family thioesterase [candidate division WOR-3 bacterium]
MNNKFVMDNRCFACGTENPVGMHLDIRDDENGVYALVKLNSAFQGYHNIIHGGIVSTILDEMAVWASFKKGCKAVTAELNVRLKKPMLADTEYIATGRVVNVKYNMVIAQAEIKERNNEIVAWADVKLIKIG